MLEDNGSLGNELHDDSTNDKDNQTIDKFVQISKVKNHQSKNKEPINNMNDDEWSLKSI